MKRISIIIATFNAGRTLQNCLDSIREQKDDDIELLIIDGKSIDGTVDIVNRNKVLVDYFVSESDHGIYDAWNKGILASHGQWILFIGADDKLMPNALDRYRFFLTKSTDSYDYISARAYYLNQYGKVIKIIGDKWDWKTFQTKMTVVHVASLHNRDLFEEIGFFDTAYKICADYELLLRKKDKLKAYFLNEVVVQMQTGGVSMSKKAIVETCEILDKYVARNSLARLFLKVWKYFCYYLFLLKMKLKDLFYKYWGDYI